MNAITPVIEYPTDWTDYELIDTGDGEKLERFGSYILVRPDPRIIWKKSNHLLWERADATYIRSSSTDGTWTIKRSPPENWSISYKKLTFILRATEFKHTGVFPEQAVNWEWIKTIINNQQSTDNMHQLKILNLFAYTGGATLAAAEAGAMVTHVDSSKGTIEWAHVNAQASGLDHKPIRWICEDVMKFITREIRRGNTYDGIILDPPRFGHGTKGEIWKLEKDLPKLLDTLKHILSPQPALLLVNAYTADISSIALGNAIKDLMIGYDGRTTIGELTIKQTANNRIVPNGIFVRWNKK